MADNNRSIGGVSSRNPLQPGEVVSMHDFGPQRKAKDAWVASELAVRTVLDAAVDAIITINEQGVVELANRATERLFGWKPMDLIGQRVTVLMPPPHRDEHDGYLEEYLRTGIKRVIGVSREVVALRKDGTTFPTLLAVSEIHLPPGDKKERDGRKMFAGIARDISDLKDAQRRLVQSERLAAIGEAMTGLAHESRNALARSQAALDMLERRIHTQPELLAFLNRVRKAQEDLHHLYEEVREYAAPIKLKLTTCRLDEIVGETWQQLQPEWEGRSITLQQRYSIMNLECRVDRFAIRQVFCNILENALQACEDSAHIEIGYSSAELNNKPAIRVSIRDNGPGFNPAQLPKLFQSFYTTKIKGTGLGLAICKRFVECHGGRICVGNTNHCGGEVVVTLPTTMEQTPDRAIQRRIGRD